MEFTLYSFITGVLRTVEGAAQAVFPLPPLRKEELSVLVSPIVERCRDVFHQMIQKAANDLQCTAPIREDPFINIKMQEVKSAITTVLETPDSLLRGMRLLKLNWEFVHPREEFRKVGLELSLAISAIRTPDASYAVNVEPWEVLTRTHHRIPKPTLDPITH